MLSRTEEFRNKLIAPSLSSRKAFCCHLGLFSLRRSQVECSRARAASVCRPAVKPPIPDLSAPLLPRNSGCLLLKLAHGIDADRLLQVLHLLRFRFLFSDSSVAMPISVLFFPKSPQFILSFSWLPFVRPHPLRQYPLIVRRPPPAAARAAILVYLC